jgi:hypothetical protein
MRIKTLSLFLMSGLIVLQSACHNEEPGPCGCTNIDVVTRIVITDDENRNLLDPATPGHFNADDIRIYYVREGERKEAFQANLDNPRFFAIEQYGSDNEYTMKLFPDMEVRNTEVTTTIVKWNSAIEDTVECEIFKNDNTISITKVWYNGELAYDQQKTVQGVTVYQERLIRTKK